MLKLQGNFPHYPLFLSLSPQLSPSFSTIPSLNVVVVRSYVL